MFCYQHRFWVLKAVIVVLMPVIGVALQLFSTCGESEAERLRRQMDDYVIQQPNFHERLEAKYSLGYVVFYIEGDRLIFDARQDILVVDWDQARILETSTDYVTVALPPLRDRDGTIMRNVKATFPLRAGTMNSIFGRPGYGVIAECIDPGPGSIVAVVGLELR